MILLDHNLIFPYAILMRFRPVSHRGTCVITLHNSASKKGMQSPHPVISKPVTAQQSISLGALPQFRAERLGTQPSGRRCAWVMEPWHCSPASWDKHYCLRDPESACEKEGRPQPLSQVLLAVWPLCSPASSLLQLVGGMLKVSLAAALGRFI